MDIPSADLERFYEEVQNVLPIKKRWLANRKELKRLLLLLADDLNKHQKNINIAKLTGTSVSVIGTALVVGGFAASFATFGTSLTLSFIGGAIGGVGGLTMAGSSVAHYVINRRTYKKAQAAIDKDQKLTEELESAVNDLSPKTLEILKYTFTFTDKALLLAGFAQSAKIIGKNFITDSIEFASMLKISAKAADLATDAGGTAFKAMSGLAKGFHFAGFAFGVIVLPFDIYAIVKASMSLHKGNTSEAENKIREIVKEMYCPDD